MKVTKSVAFALAAHLFELELNSISKETDFHFEFNGWIDKFGEVSIKYESQLTSSPDNQFNAQAIEKIADEVQKDFESGFWSIGSCDSGLYNYMMPIQYGRHITEALEMQLAMLSGTGIQQELNFA